jgi:MoaA/NifB/PqqE/SkfB family radical SAM enzyme
VQPGWVRLSRTCNNACVFCDDADQLTGAPVPIEEVKAAIDAVAASGATEVVLSGGEPTLSKSLLAAIRHGKAAGLRVALTTNGRIVQSEKIAKMLEDTGLDEIRVSVHSGRRSTHDKLVGKDNGWVESLAGLRFMGRTKVRVVLKSVLTKVNEDELAHLMHLAMMGGAKGMELRYLQATGAARKLPELQVSPKVATAILSTLWYEAKEEVLDFDGVGFDGTLDLGFEAHGEPRQPDLAAMRLLRRRVFLAQAFQGFTVLGDEDGSKDLVLLAEAEGGVAQVGLELAARSTPVLDAPWCVGGRPSDPARWGADALYGDACGGCPARAACPGLPSKAKKLGTDALAPLPTWSGTTGTALVTGGRGDDLLRARTLPALAAALTAEGVPATYDAEATASDAELVVCGDAASARPFLAARRAGQRVVVLDGSGGEDLAELPSAPDVLESFTPGRVDRLRAAGIDLRTVRWRPYPVPPVCSDAAIPEGAPIVALGEAADWKAIEAALVHATGKLPPVHAYGPASMPESGVWTRHVDADDATVLVAVLASKLVVWAPAPGDDADHRRRLARDLRWLAVAQAAGRPVVVGRGPAADDQVRHDRTGWMCPATGPAALSEGLRRVNGEPLRYGRYAAEARALMELASVTAWARELVHGRAPGSVAPRPDAQRPHVVW